jgi:minimal PKS acyl carrier protein
MGDVGLAELSAILQNHAGDDGSGPLTEDTIDTSFQDLGYDSLAILELAGRIRRQYKVVIPDDQATGQLTPRDLLRLVNDGIQVG